MFSQPYLTSLNIYDNVCVIMICTCLNGAVCAVGLVGCELEDVSNVTWDISSESVG